MGGSRQDEGGVGDERGVARAGIGLLAGVVLAAGIGVVLLHDPGTPRTVGTAVEDFRVDSRGGQRDDHGRGDVTRSQVESGRPGTPSPGERKNAASTSAAVDSSGGPPSAGAGRVDAGAAGGAAGDEDSPRPADASDREADAGSADRGGNEPAGTQEETRAARSRPEPRPEGPPRAGVYVYDTDGQEHLDAFGGSTHTYPDETTITVSHRGCGHVTRWQPLEERFDEYEVCDARNPYLARITLYHEFFEQSDRRDFVCGDDAVVGRPGASAGETWTWTCTADVVTLTTRVTIVETGAFTVGGETVDAVRLRMDSTLEGEMRGTRRADVWYDRRGLELHGTYVTDVQVKTPVGYRRYTEDVTRTLQDLAPRR